MTTETIQTFMPTEHPGTPAIEVAFLLTEPPARPFEAEVWAWLDGPDGQRRLPAFYDGDRLWRVRHTPRQAGLHRWIGVTVGPAGADRHARAEWNGASHFEVVGAVGRGFIRRSPHRTQQFVFDGGGPYFPFGVNAAWGEAGHYDEHFGRMAALGMNWSRVWMAHWAGLNMDWRTDRRLDPGELDLDVARGWDRIISAAERHGIYLQLVLQHHGQLSTFVNANWHEHPWNVRNGGFLKQPADFFTSEEARRRTRLKYRTIVARWGYSTAIMAWELFNEVEFTDAWAGSRWVAFWKRKDEAPRIDQPSGEDAAAVVRWHGEMADWLRALDPYGHLVTTSSVPAESALWEKMDYHQPHCYEREMAAMVRRLAGEVGAYERPVFFGEVGDHQMKAADKADGRYSRAMLWAGLMSGGAGAAQLWDWSLIRRDGFEKHFASAAGFIRAARFGERAFAPAEVQMTEGAGAKVLSGLGVRAADRAALWIWRTDADHRHAAEAATARVRIEGMPEGHYRADWWDTESGRTGQWTEAFAGSDGGLNLFTPPIRRDLAALIERCG